MQPITTTTSHMVPAESHMVPTKVTWNQKKAHGTKKKSHGTVSTHLHGINVFDVVATHGKGT
eukprot:m.328593 g.328593  ORF g.328593 m.328593 type:complete len:62 (+) comp20434_c0_seq2:268-453(+)